MTENLDLTKGIQIISPSSMETPAAPTLAPPISSTSVSTPVGVTDFLGFSIEFWLVTFLILGLGALAYLYWDQIQGVLFGEASSSAKPSTSDAANVVAEDIAGVITEAIDIETRGGSGYPCELGRDKDGRPVIVRVASRKMCK